MCLNAGLVVQRNLLRSLAQRNMHRQLALITCAEKLARTWADKLEKFKPRTWAENLLRELAQTHLLKENVAEKFAE